MKMHIDFNDSKVIDELFNDNYLKWVHYAESLIGDYEDARDIVADSLIKLMEQKHNVYVNSSHIQGYLYAVIRNSCLDYLRRDKFRSKAKDHLKQTVPLTENVIELKYQEVELIQLLIKRINSLPEKMKEVFKMTYLDGYSRAELAKVLKVSEHTIRNTNAAAMKIIRITFGNFLMRL